MRKMRTTRSLSKAMPFVAVAVTLMVASCGGDDEGGAQDGGTGEPVEIQLWVPSSGFDEAETALVEDFNASQDDIEIEYVSIPAADMIENLTTAMRAGEGPDVYTGPAPDAAINGGFAMALNDLVSEETKEQFAPHIEAKHPRSVDGQFYSLPRGVTTARLVYNKELFSQAGLDPEAPPTTFSEVREAARVITESSDGDAFGYGLSLAWGGVYQLQVEPLILASDPDLTQMGLFNQEQQLFETWKYAPVVELYQQLIDDGSMFPGVSSLDRDQTRAAFAAGELGMYVGTSLEVGVLNDQLGAEFDWGGAQLPVADGQEFVRSIANVGSEMFLNPATDHLDESVRVLELFIGEDLVQRLTEAGQVYPVHPDIPPDSGPTDKTGYQDFFPTSVDVQWPLRPVDILEIRGETYQDVLERLILQGGDIEGELRAVASTYTDVYDEAVEAGTIDPELYRP